LEMTSWLIAGVAAMAARTVAAAKKADFVTKDSPRLQDSGTR